MRILALDLATHFGFACGSVKEGMVESGSYKIPPTHENLGLFGAYFRRWLDGAITRLEPAVIIYESPILPGVGQTNLATLRKLYGLCLLTEVIADDHSVVCEEANLSDIRAHALGKGNIPRKRDDVKRAVIAWCRSRGWNPLDDNHADALALLSYRLALIDRSFALKAMPLFRQAEPAAT